MPACWLQQRQAGVLLHPTSLPCPAGQGDLGPAAFQFIDYLAATGFSVWQMLPIGPVHDDRSPYLARSSLAGHTGLLSAAVLREQGLLDRQDAAAGSDLPERRQLVRRAWQHFRHQADAAARTRLLVFVREQGSWLPDYALFRALGRRHEGRPWPEWSQPWRTPDPLLRAQLHDALYRRLAGEGLRRLPRDPSGNLPEDMALECFGQYLFFDQWSALRDHAGRRGVSLFGDLPIYVAHDSADMWRQPDLFRLDADGQPLEVAGVPPDAFAPQGQRWGNPLHDWAHQAADDYRWWIQRLRHQHALFDLLRLDHFRGFHAFWAIAADAPTAAEGEWRPGPDQAFFDRVTAVLGPLRLVAEDLGNITPAVEALRTRNGFPGMRVLQFGFEGGTDNPHRPDNHVPEAVVYTGTHDNDTIMGWWQSLPPEHRQAVQDAIGGGPGPVHQRLVAATLASPARLAIVPMQDLLGLGPDARMNIPGTTDRNWRWQLNAAALATGPPRWIVQQLEESGRLGP